MRKESLATTELPKSDFSLLAQSLNASFITPESYPIKLMDKVRANLAGTPENWAFARAIASQLKADDVVFCPGEEIGVPLAILCGGKKERPKVIVWFHRITGLRSRVVLKLFNIGRLVDLAVVSSLPNQIFLQNHLNLTDEQILFWWHPINTDYFASKISSSNKNPQNPRPLVVSSGLERRDYSLLAAATGELDVDVKVAGFSQFQSRVAKNFPKVMPENMSNKKYSLPELVKLYHDADVVAICLRENDGTCGVTVLLEAMACRKPIVCTRTRGLSDYLDDEQAVMTIKPGDVAGLQKAILSFFQKKTLAFSDGMNFVQGLG
ncbi:MAG: glycosyltransferase family 4 protein [Waterburya sp.]